MAEQVMILPKVYINAMPKSGLHAIWLALLPTVRGTTHKGPWGGTYDENGWGLKWLPREMILEGLDLLIPGLYLKAHAGWAQWLDEALNERGFCQVFLYRDLRDVAVSQAFHCLSPDDPLADRKLWHPGKAEYRAINEAQGFEGVLRAVIEGLPNWPGLFERWAQYAPWLESEWVLAIQYEDLMAQPIETLSKVLKYLFGRAAGLEGFALEVDEADLVVAAGNCLDVMRETGMSPSFREGKSGGWAQHFTPSLVASFKERAGTWLVDLGYEQDGEWGI